LANSLCAFTFYNMVALSSYMQLHYVQIWNIHKICLENRNIHLLNYFTVCCGKPISRLCVSLDYFNFDIIVILSYVPVHVWHFSNLKKHRSYLNNNFWNFTFTIEFLKTAWCSTVRIISLQMVQSYIKAKMNY
jgi:hypothetical protein